MVKMRILFISKLIGYVEIYYKGEIVFVNIV